MASHWLLENDWESLQLSQQDIVNIVEEANIDEDDHGEDVINVNVLENEEAIQNDDDDIPNDDQNDNEEENEEEDEEDQYDEEDDEDEDDDEDDEDARNNILAAENMDDEHFVDRMGPLTKRRKIEKTSEKEDGKEERFWVRFDNTYLQKSLIGIYNE